MRDRMSRKWVIVTAVVVVAALAIGVFASHALSGGDDQRALPPVGPTQKLIGPNDGTFGDAPASSPAPATPTDGVPKPNVVGDVQRLASAHGSGGGSGGTRASGSSTTAGSGAPATPPSSASSASTAPTTGPLTADGPISPADPSAPRVLGGVGLVHFTDPCAASGGGATGVCRDIGGIGGTILPIGNQVPAFEILGASSAYCADTTGYDVDSPMFVVHSTAPGRFWVHVQGTTDPSKGGVLREGDAVATSADEVARWEASDRTTDVVTCFAVAGGLTVDPSHRYTAHIDGLSDPDGLQHGTYDLDFTYQRGGRPPVVVTPGLLTTDRLIGVSLAGGPTRVPHLELRTSGSSTFAPNCPDDVLLAMPELGGGTDIPTSELRAADYPYSRLFTQRYNPTFTTAKDISTGAQVPLDINTKYALCIRWVDPASPNSTPSDARPLSLRLESPDRYQMQLRVKAIDFPTARPFTVDLSTFGGDCRIHLTGNARHLQYIDAGFDNTNFAYDTGGDPAASATAYPNGPTSCDQADPMAFADAGGYAIGPDGRLSLEVDATVGGTTYESSIWVPISACSPDGSPCPFQQSFHEDYTMPLGSAANGSVTFEAVFLHNALYHGSTPWPIDDPHPNPHYAWTGGGSY